MVFINRPLVCKMPKLKRSSQNCLHVIPLFPIATLHWSLCGYSGGAQASPHWRAQSSTNAHCTGTRAYSPTDVRLRCSHKGEVSQGYYCVRIISTTLRSRMLFGKFSNPGNVSVGLERDYWWRRRAKERRCKNVAGVANLYGFDRCLYVRDRPIPQ